MGAKLLLAVKVNVGVGLAVMFPTRGVIALVSGMGCTLLLGENGDVVAARLVT